MAFIRRVRTKSGATRVQVAEYSGGRQRMIKHVGSAHTDAELEVLPEKARSLIAPAQDALDFEVEPAPRVEPARCESMAYYGLNQGHRFGFIGSTDHHSAHPGSHGYGRMAVWATELTRAGSWDAIVNRRTYAVTGDRIELRSAVNGIPMGGIAPANPERRVRASITARDRIDLVEVVRNGNVIWSGTGTTAPPEPVFNGLRVEYTVGELSSGPRSGYTAGFVSPAFQFHRAVADSERERERELEVDVEDVRQASGRDCYHVRVRQSNDQWAFGTPTWLGA